ncbi:molybdopterin-dependent oxidoreductase [Novosphingobium flavum]|uniref:Molybdopterin-dependent oxidoreductase n=1 Tax=Novosphingobium flavum TaxID=1778672 RepID=A0A7X1KLT1_9SPHN|nr:molybdopterin-dependent oxidoreductase [Novosphingobium flavum]MBC2665907.1 molybdopterin-dependent oxidoreductase [Novosphingobium flavum]
MAEPISRRGLIAAGGSLLLAGCDKLNGNPALRGLLISAEDAHRASQRLLTGGALAPEFAENQRSPNFRSNGNATAAGNAEWDRHAAENFARWSLRVDGLVMRPLDLTLEALKALPQRSQITRHDCVEGWSAIGGWTGPQLGTVLRMASLLPAARYLVFHCADRFGPTPYYESIDLIDAFHPQTILAHTMNGGPLPTGHGAPLRLRVERQLGYKQAKYVMRIEARASLAGLYGGKGGFWEDRSDYAWYAGI